MPRTSRLPRQHETPVDARTVCGDTLEADTSKFIERAPENETGPYRGSEDMCKTCEQIACITPHKSLRLMVPLHRRSQSER